SLLLGQAVGVHPGEPEDQCGLAVVDVSGRGHDLKGSSGPGVPCLGERAHGAAPVSPVGGRSERPGPAGRRPRREPCGGRTPAPRLRSGRTPVAAPYGASPPRDWGRESAAPPAQKECRTQEANLRLPPPRSAGPPLHGTSRPVLWRGPATGSAEPTGGSTAESLPGGWSRRDEGRPP